MKDSLDRIDFATRRKGGVDSRIVIVCEYSKSGQIVARTANGVRQTYEYDKKGQLLAVKNADGNAVERYAYDKAGNMLKKQILRSGRAGAPRTPQSDDYITTTFTFDDANQLVSSTTDGVTTRYTYDAAGRLVREGNKRYTYGYLDKVMSVTDGDTTRTFTYHADGQLASATVGSALRADRGATPLSETETFLWDGLALIQRGDEQFVNEPHIGGGNPVASSKGTSYFNDALGTTVGSKSNGKYSAAALTAFGEDLTVHSPTPTQNSNFFTGKPFVEGLGHAFLMRNYRAGLAKWQTADPLGYPDGWNQLAYCGNGVTGAVDLWGCAEERWVEILPAYEWDVDVWPDVVGQWREIGKTSSIEPGTLAICASHAGDKEGWVLCSFRSSKPVSTFSTEQLGTEWIIEPDYKSCTTRSREVREDVVSYSIDFSVKSTICEAADLASGICSILGLAATLGQKVVKVGGKTLGKLGDFSTEVGASTLLKELTETRSVLFSLEDCGTETTKYVKPVHGIMRSWIKE